MAKYNKKRLFEVFENVNKLNLKEWYDDEYYEKSSKIPDLNPEDIRQVKELFTYLSVDGIPDIYEVYPRWLVDKLKDDGHIHENPQNYAWEFTPEGREYFEDANDLQEYLLDDSNSGGNDSEAPFLRGNEPMSEGILYNISDDVLIDKLQASLDLQQWNLVREVIFDLKNRRNSSN